MLIMLSVNKFHIIIKMSSLSGNGEIVNRDDNTDEDESCTLSIW